MHLLSDTRFLIAIDTWAPVAHQGWRFGHAPFVQKQSAMVTREMGKHGLAHFFMKALVARHEMVHATVPPHPEILYIHATAPQLWLCLGIASCYRLSDSTLKQLTLVGYQILVLYFIIPSGFSPGFNFFIFHYIWFNIAFTTGDSWTTS